MCAQAPWLFVLPTHVLRRARMHPCNLQEAAEKEVGFLEHLDNMVGRKKTVEEERPQTVDIMELVGFDPEKEYTNKEITALAAKAVKVSWQYKEPFCAHTYARPLLNHTPTRSRWARGSAWTTTARGGSRRMERSSATTKRRSGSV